MPRRMKMQRRGKAKPRYISPSHRYKAIFSYPVIKEKSEGEIVDIMHDPARSAPVLVVDFGGRVATVPAADGLRVGNTISFLADVPKAGNVMRLKDIPEGTEIFNIELIPGDGGKIIRGAGLSGQVVLKDEKGVTVKLPSKAMKKFNPECLATIGVIAGGGRGEKPILKAGKKRHMLSQKTRIWPIVAGKAMNPVDHPFGGGKRRHKKKKTVSRRKPSGKRVGSIAARRTGRRRGTT